jgi:sugar diacid utilization regulator
MADSRTHHQPHHQHHRRAARDDRLSKGSARLLPAAPRREPCSPARTSVEHALDALTEFSRVLLGTPDEGDILRLAMGHVAATGPYRAVAGYLEVDGELVPDPTGAAPAPGLGRRLRDLAGDDGPVRVSGGSWGRALGLRGVEGIRGYLVVTSPSRPTEAERSLLTALVGHTTAALSLAFTQRRRREEARELHRLRKERTALQLQLIRVVAELGYQRAAHALMADIAASGGGEKAVTRALHRITGLPALVEDRFGRPRSWTGPGRPDPYPEPDPVRQDELLNAVAREAGPVRIKNRLITLVRPHDEILGVLALVDPDGEADEHTVLALNDAATSLALELTHLRDLAEVELRLHRELVDDLLAGTAEASTYARSEAVGHDLHRSQYVVAVRWSDRTADDSFARTVGRAASEVGMRALLTWRSDHVILITDARPHAHALYEALARETGAPSGTIGVSAPCASPDAIPRGYRDAQRALTVRGRSRERYGTTFFDELGLYRVLGPGNDQRELKTFVDEWLGQLIDYDAWHKTSMVETLSRYFDCGGNYDETAASLRIHRSTLRYRLKRIHDISGRDLANAEERLNLQVATRVWKIAPGGPP